MKITQRQLNGFHKADRELLGIGFNDNYNMATYGITRATSNAILSAFREIEGLTGKSASLKQINEVLKNK